MHVIGLSSNALQCPLIAYKHCHLLVTACPNKTESLHRLQYTLALLTAALLILSPPCVRVCATVKQGRDRAVQMFSRKKKKAEAPAEKDDRVKLFPFRRNSKRQAPDVPTGWQSARLYAAFFRTVCVVIQPDVISKSFFKCRAVKTVTQLWMTRLTMHHRRRPRLQQMLLSRRQPQTRIRYSISCDYSRQESRRHRTHRALMAITSWPDMVSAIERSS